LPRNTWSLCRKASPELGLHWVTHHPTVTVLDVNTTDPAVIKDIDTPEDYAELTGVTLNG
jgi:CTP:molybdopterin cytidylyltransferase MocA